MRIGELSGRSRRNAFADARLRYYEEQKLFVPQRLPSGYRQYDERAVVAERIRVLLSSGLGTSAIAEIVACTIDASVILVGRCTRS